MAEQGLVVAGLLSQHDHEHCRESISPHNSEVKAMCRDELALWHARLLMQLAASVAEQSASDAIQYLDLACDVAPAGQMVSLASACTFSAHQSIRCERHADVSSAEECL